MICDLFFTRTRSCFALLCFALLFSFEINSHRYKQIRSGELQKGRGTGLGLCLSLHIIVLHHGVIEVVSGPEVGSTFSFFIPLGETPQACSRERKASGEKLIMPIRTIAVVDDQKSNLQLTAMCLKQLQYEVCYDVITLNHLFEWRIE